MSNPTLSHAVALPYIGDGNDDPNVFTLAEIAVTISVDSAVVSSTTSQVVSTAASGALDSVPVSTADSKAVSSGTRASIADSKAVSVSSNTSVADSKALSGSINTSIADSKAVSVAAAATVLTVVAHSENISRADSKAVSVATYAAVPASGRSVTALSTYLTNNAVYNVRDFGALGNGTTDDYSAIQAAINAAEAASGGKVLFPPGRYKVGTMLTVETQGIHLEGAGTATSTTGSRIDLVAATGIGLDFNPDNASDFTSFSIRNLTFFGNQSDADSLIRMRRCYIVDIAGCHFVDAGTQLVELTSCGHVHLVGNTFSWNAAPGASFSSVLLSGCSHLSIGDNTFEGVLSGSNLPQHIVFASTASNRVTIAGNSFGERSLRAIIVQSGGLSYASITGNVAHDLVTAGNIFCALGGTCDTVIIEGNAAISDGASSSIGIACNSGTLTNITIGPNQMTGFEKNYVLSSITSGRVLLDGIVHTPAAALALGNTNNYDPAQHAGTFRISADAGGSALTGMLAGIAGERRRIINPSANSLTINNQDSNSTAANRFLTPSGGNYTLGADDIADLEYDGTQQRWRVVNVTT